jgi:hypothetical protein
MTNETNKPEGVTSQDNAPEQENPVLTNDNPADEQANAPEEPKAEEQVEEKPKSPYGA